MRPIFPPNVILLDISMRMLNGLDDIGGKLGRNLQQLLSVRGSPHDFIFRFQQLPISLKHDTVIIRNDEARFRHGSPLKISLTEHRAGTED